MFRKKVKSAVIWSGFDTFIRQIIGFVISVILARLLVPEDFGTIALLSLFMAIAGLFADAGFSAALIQKRNLTHVDESTIFWFNIVAGLVITAILFALSPLISALFALPILESLTMLMACNVFISAMGSIHHTLLIKRLDFKIPMKIGVISMLISGFISIYMAMNGYGIWALAAQSLISSVIGTSLLWSYNPWRPAFVFSWHSIRRLFNFGGYIFAAALFGQIYRNGYTLLIGMFYGVRDLGFYNRAYSTQRLASNTMTGVFSNVSFPVYSQINEDVEKLRRVVRMSIRSVMLVTAPLMFGLAVVAEQFILIVFGDQWLPSAQFLPIFCVAGLFFPIHAANVSVLKAQGHAALNFRLNIIKNTIGIVFLIIGAFYGVIGIAYGVVANNVVALFINAHYTKKLLGYGLREQSFDCMPSIMLSSLMVVVVLFVDHSLTIGGAVEFLLLIVIGATFYLASNVVLGIGAFKETISFLKGDIKV